ncbi:MAG: metallophosphoesterase [Cyanobacteria bacterium J06623_4]
MQTANLPGRDTDQASAPGEQPTDNTDEPASPPTQDAPTLLTDPFLQRPTPSSVQVVWFTEFKGTSHAVEYGDGLSVAATTNQLSRTREDSDSQVQGRAFPELTDRSIWRHEATVTDLEPGDRPTYRVVSQHANGQSALSDFFTLSAAPAPGQPLQILLTSDHQLKPLTPANLQKVEETIGRVDAVFLAGDLVNIPDRASEWFDNAEGLAFFPGLQGRAKHTLEKGEQKTTYTGGQLIQHAPLFPALGNHEVMGRYSESDSLKFQFTNTLPRQLVSEFYPAPGGGEPSKAWLDDHSFNSQTYEEIFSLPTAQLPGGGQTEKYYAVTFGDVRLISLYITQIWRPPGLKPDVKGRFREKADALDTPEEWGYGQHIFEDIRAGSPQYQWLQQELASDAFKNAEYKVVMLHHPPHSLGDNIVPAFTDPVMIENRAANGTLESIQYEYPANEDYIARDLVPLLESANVQLVFFGHSHLWNRFVSPKGTHYLESSNVGNTYGANVSGNPRNVPTDAAVKEAGDLKPFSKIYSTIGDPNGLPAVVPTLAPLKDDSGNPLSYIASNDITSFSILDTGTGTVSSYYFDTRQPDSAVVKFDEFNLTAAQTQPPQAQSPQPQ